MKTTVVVCPWGAFGSGGAAHGAEALADAVRELLDDVRQERRPTRARVFRGQVRIEELTFDSPAALADWHKTARSSVRAALNRGDFLIWLGGNHLSALPVYEELAAADAAVVQFDAHLDLYNLDDSKTELNHGNFLRHAERLPSIVNLGHRDLFLTPKSIHEFYEAVHSAADLARDQTVIRSAIAEWAREADRLFLDLDCDVLDPASFPATAHPMPFGLSALDLLNLLNAAWTPRVCGVGISEFDPGRDRDERSLQLLVWLIEWILLKRYEA